MDRNGKGFKQALERLGSTHKSKMVTIISGGEKFKGLGMRFQVPPSSQDDVIIFHSDDKPDDVKGPLTYIDIGSITAIILQ